LAPGKHMPFHSPFQLPGGGAFGKPQRPVQRIYFVMVAMLSLLRSGPAIPVQLVVVDALHAGYVRLPDMPGDGDIPGYPMDPTGRITIGIRHDHCQGSCSTRDEADVQLGIDIGPIAGVLPRYGLLLTKLWAPDQQSGFYPGPDAFGPCFGMHNSFS